MKFYIQYQISKSKYSELNGRSQICSLTTNSVAERAITDLHRKLAFPDDNAKIAYGSFDVTLPLEDMYSFYGIEDPSHPSPVLIYQSRDDTNVLGIFEFLLATIKYKTEDRQTPVFMTTSESIDKMKAFFCINHKGDISHIVIIEPKEVPVPAESLLM